jgi:hypothetical protein
MRVSSVGLTVPDYLVGRMTRVQFTSAPDRGTVNCTVPPHRSSPSKCGLISVSSSCSTSTFPSCRRRWRAQWIGSCQPRRRRPARLPRCAKVKTQGSGDFSPMWAGQAASLGRAFACLRAHENACRRRIGAHACPWCGAGLFRHDAQARSPGIAGLDAGRRLSKGNTAPRQPLPDRGQGIGVGRFEREQ